MDNEWTLVGHLTDLRKRVIYSAIALLVTFSLSLAFVSRILGYLERPLGHVRLAVLGPGDVIQIYFSMAAFAAIGLSLPILLYQLWKFIQPALHAKEQKLVYAILPFVTIMFVGGVAFSYFVVLPLVLHFLIGLSRANFALVLTAQRYFQFVTNLTLPFGLIFEMPIVLLFLTEIGIVNVRSLGKMRKYAYFMIIILASLISPPEFISHLSVAVPMMVLYELSIFLCKFRMRQKIRNEMTRDLAEDVKSKQDGRSGI